MRPAFSPSPCGRGLGGGGASAMSHNSFGHLFRVTTWGESHGPAIGCVVDGCPPRISLSEADIQPWLDRRRPGQSRFTTQRQEPDAGPHPVRRVRWRDHRHADRHADRQRGPALARLLRDRRAVPSRPRRPDLRAEIRHPRLSRRRPVLGARDRDARGGRRRRAQGAGRRRAHPRRPGADRPTPHRPRPLGLGRGGRQSVLLPRPGHGGALGDLSVRGPQGRLVGRRGDRGGGRRRPTRPGRTDLRQARCRHRRRR